MILDSLINKIVQVSKNQLLCRPVEVYEREVWAARTHDRATRGQRAARIVNG